jgi:hypothetical protein
MRRNFNTNYQLFYNAQLQTTLSETDGNTTPPNPRIGRHASISNQGLRGYIHELIVYNFALNSAQTIIVNNYLASKYGYTLASNDLYTQDNSPNGNFDFDVAGIGRVNSSNIHNDAQGTGIIRILNPSNLEDDEFMIWGHNNGFLDADEKTDVPTGVAARFLRVWRVSERNANNTADVDVGNIDMRWDLNGIGPITDTDLRLLIDTDNDGFFSDETPISGATHLGGGIYQFSNVPGGSSGIQNDRRFTLGTINANQTPLPIKISFFKVKNIHNKQVKLEWQTSSEINNDYFNIERSADGINWIDIFEIKGAGNSYIPINYEIIDNNPLSNVSYYRLKQTDFDGHYEYSSMRSVNIDNYNHQVSIWPNPSKGIIILKTSTMVLSELKVYNSMGVDITHSIIFTAKNEEEIVIDFSHLANGLYYIKTGTTSNIVIKQ